MCNFRTAFNRRGSDRVRWLTKWDSEIGWAGCTRSTTPRLWVRVIPSGRSTSLRVARMRWTLVDSSRTPATMNSTFWRGLTETATSTTTRNTWRFPSWDTKSTGYHSWHLSPLHQAKTSRFHFFVHYQDFCHSERKSCVRLFGPKDDACTLFMC